jgi:predicted transposase YbfD/YdcC
MTDAHISLEEITCHFDELEDPRSTINQRHPLVSVVVIAIMAVLAGAAGPTSIADWAQYKAAFLKGHLDLPNGVPRKDVFRRVLSLLKPDAFQACFANWLTSLRAAVAVATGITQPILVVDGKTLRRSHDASRNLGALHSVSVWASDFGLSLGQVACAEKSNEITAIPELLRLVEIRGAIITIDAMGTQKAIAAQIVDQEADYVLALKGNQESLHNAVIECFDQHNENDFANVEVQTHATMEQAHGRQETRSYFQLPIPNAFAGRQYWKGLKSIGMVISVVTRDGQEHVETRYFIMSLAPNVKQFARAVRSHWGIENTCHWTLDVTFREDESRIRTEQLRENFAWLNRFALSLLKQYKNGKTMAANRRGCGWNENTLIQVLTGATI